MYDTVRGRALVDAHTEAVHQISLADTIVLTKTDLVDDLDVPAHLLHGLNDVAIVVDAQDEFDPDLLEGTATAKTETAPLHQHALAYQSTVLHTDKSLSLSALAGLLHTFANQLGDNLLRIKGLAKIDNEPAPVAVQVSGNIVHDFVKMEQWPEGINATQLVVITEALDTQTVQNLFSGFIGEITLDAPDQHALMHNPLAIPGL